MPPRFAAYTEASKAVFAVFEDTTPLVEGISIDEAFLDVGGLRRIAGTPVEIAARLRADVRERVGLAITVGVARTKFLAKVASGVAKPDGLLLVPPDGELAFLHPLPIERLWGVGAKTAEKLHARGITTVGDMAAARRGPAGHACSAATPAATSTPWPHNRDPAAGAGRRPPALDRLAARPRPAPPHAGRARHRPRRASSTASPGGCGPPSGSGAPSCCGCGSTTSPAPPARTRLPAPTAETEPILAVARALLAAAMPMIERRRASPCSASPSANLDDDDAVQLALPFDRHAGGALDATLDDIKRRSAPPPSTRTVLLGPRHRDVDAHAPGLTGCGSFQLRAAGDADRTPEEHHARTATDGFQRR